MIKCILPHLSVHSLRRGAVTALAEQFQGSEVLLLTGHSTQMEPREIRRYTAPLPNSTEALLQRRMVAFLLEKLKTAPLQSSKPFNRVARQLTWN